MNDTFTLLRRGEENLAPIQCLWQDCGMIERKTTAAGGCFVTLGLFAGYFLGLAIADPMRGVLTGLGVGIVLAILVWLADSRRRD